MLSNRGWAQEVVLSPYIWKCSILFLLKEGVKDLHWWGLYCFRHPLPATHYRLAQTMRQDFKVSILKVTTLRVKTRAIFTYTTFSKAIFTSCSFTFSPLPVPCSIKVHRIGPLVKKEFSLVFELIQCFISLLFPSHHPHSCLQVVPCDRNGQKTLLPSLRYSQPRRELSPAFSLQLPRFRGSEVALQPSLIALLHTWDLPRGQSQHLEARNHVSHPKLSGSYSWTGTFR